MKPKEQLANFLTLLNLACGVLAIIFLWRENLTVAGLLIFLGAAFDALDGLVARALKISSDIGKQLDSLSDMVTFGIVPGLIAYSLLKNPLSLSVISEAELLSLLIPVFSAIRLAKFNIDSRQSKDFIGMPTPANALLWAACGIIIHQQIHWLGLAGGMAEYLNMIIRGLFLSKAFMIFSILVTSLLLVLPVHVMGLKFNGLSWKGNEGKFLMLITSIFLLLFLGVTGIPVIIILYPVFSFFNRTFIKA